MKLFKYSGFFFGIVCVFLLFTQFSQNKSQFEFSSYTAKIEDRIKFETYNAKYEELTWLKGDEPICGFIGYNKQIHPSNNIYLSLKFLDAMISGEYLDFLDLYLEEGKSLRLNFTEFLDFHDELDKMVVLSKFSMEEFKDILFYALILGTVENSEVFKEKAWVYGTSSLGKVLLMYQDVLPTLKRFSMAQKKLLSLIMESFQVEGFLDKYEKNAFSVGTSCRSIEKDFESFDISLLIFICAMAGKYTNGPL